jgi:hypothetical protein
MSRRPTGRPVEPPWLVLVNDVRMVVITLITITAVFVIGVVFLVLGHLAGRMIGVVILLVGVLLTAQLVRALRR